MPQQGPQQVDVMSGVIIKLEVFAQSSIKQIHSILLCITDDAKNSCVHELLAE